MIFQKSVNNLIQPLERRGWNYPKVRENLKVFNRLNYGVESRNWALTDVSKHWALNNELLMWIFKLQFIYFFIEYASEHSVSSTRRLEFFRNFDLNFCLIRIFNEIFTGDFQKNILIELNNY